jgi:hypothetical protein
LSSNGFGTLILGTIAERNIPNAALIGSGEGCVGKQFGDLCSTRIATDKTLVSILVLAAVSCLKTTTGDWLLTETYIAGAIGALK